MKENNCKLIATLNERGFVELAIDVNGIVTSIKVNDFNGKCKKTARKLSYKIYKSLGGK